MGPQLTSYTEIQLPRGHFPCTGPQNTFKTPSKAHTTADSFCGISFPKSTAERPFTAPHTLSVQQSAGRSAVHFSLLNTPTKLQRTRWIDDLHEVSRTTLHFGATKAAARSIFSSLQNASQDGFMQALESSHSSAFQPSVLPCVFFTCFIQPGSRRNISSAVSCFFIFSIRSCDSTEKRYVLAHLRER